MKKLTCELCGSNDFVKEEGLFVCQSCGTKYSPDEARKMMIEGIVEVKGSVQIDNRSILSNYIFLAEDALNSKDFSKADDYAQRALDVDVSCVKAWIIKLKNSLNDWGKNTYDISPVISNGRSMIKHAPASETAYVEELVYSAYAEKAKEITLESVNRMLKDPKSMDMIEKDAERYNKKPSYFLEKQIEFFLEEGNERNHYNVEKSAYKLMNEIPTRILTDYPQLRKKVSDWLIIREDALKALCDVLDCYISFLLKRDKRIAYEEAAKQSQSHWKDENNIINARLNEAINNAEQIKDQKIAAYWEEHAEEKVTLDKERLSLQERAAFIKREIKNSPEFVTVKNINEAIVSTQKDLKAISIFKIREKKVLQQKIEYLNSQLDTAKKALQIAMAPYDQEDSKIKARICEIDKRLNLLQ